MARTILVFLLLWGTSFGVVAGAPIAAEPLGVIETLPKRYPADWFLVHDASFFHMSDGKFYVIDTSQDTLGNQVKGLINNSQLGSMLPVPERGEIMSVETFYSRGTRGERTDVLTIWDTENLDVVGEVLLPENKRFMGLPQRVALLTLNDNKWLAIFNMNPSTSVTLVDLDKRKVINDIQIPGCTFLYEMGGMGFSSICIDGRLLSVQLNEDGSERMRSDSDIFFDSDDSPVFARPARVDHIAYFPSFDGMVHPIDLSGDVALPLTPWSLVPEENATWAPSGLGLDGEDELGRIYFLMNSEANGVDGMHNAGGSEVWVYDPQEEMRVLRIPLQEWGISIAVGRGPEPKLLVTNPMDMSIELYDGLSGEFLKKITGFGQETPLFLWGTR